MCRNPDLSSCNITKADCMWLGIHPHCSAHAYSNELLFSSQSSALHLLNANVVFLYKHQSMEALIYLKLN